MKRLSEAALGAVLLLVLWLSVPVPSFGSFGFGIFNIVLGTIKNSIGLPASNMEKVLTAENAFNQATVFPETVVNNYRNFASQISSVYRPWMNQVYSLPVSSTSIPTDSTFESLLHSGNANNLGRLNSDYSSVYGSIPTPSDASTPYQEQADAIDSTALASDGLSIKADQSATALISQSQALSDQARSTGQGTATMVAAQAEALQLESLAIQHAELAAMLRDQATRVANIGSAMKQVSVSGNNAGTVTNNILGSNSGGN